jgi:hypothetical protein
MLTSEMSSDALLNFNTSAGLVTTPGKGKSQECHIKVNVPATGAQVVGHRMQHSKGIASEDTTGG